MLVCFLVETMAPKNILKLTDLYFVLRLEGFERGFVTSLAGKNSIFVFYQKWLKTNPFKNYLKSLIRANLILENLTFNTGKGYLIR